MQFLCSNVSLAVNVFNFWLLTLPSHFVKCQKASHSLYIASYGYTLSVLVEVWVEQNLSNPEAVTAEGYYLMSACGVLLAFVIGFTYVMRALQFSGTMKEGSRFSILLIFIIASLLRTATVPEMRRMQRTYPALWKARIYCLLTPSSLV